MKLLSAIRFLFSDFDLFMERLTFYVGSDRQYLKYWFKNKMGYYPNLDNPRTYNEKLQWLKLHYRKPIMTTMVDKDAVKKYVADKIGEEFIIPTLGVWDTFDDIDFDKLPNQFVLKCTHDSGGLIICKDKSNFDKVAAKVKIEQCLKTNFYKYGREWPYKNVPRRVIAEKYMAESSISKKNSDLADYKFFCFNGNVKWLFIASDRYNREEPYFDFFDMEFNHLDMRHGHPNAPFEIKKPLNFELMKELSAKLSEGFPHMRVDLYEVDGKVYFGEITFFHHTGRVLFDPVEWDTIFGGEILLPI